MKCNIFVLNQGWLANVDSGWLMNGATISNLRQGKRKSLIFSCKSKAPGDLNSPRKGQQKYKEIKGNTCKIFKSGVELL